MEEREEGLPCWERTREETTEEREVEAVEVEEEEGRGGREEEPLGAGGMLG